jgi:hypothetical protein
VALKKNGAIGMGNHDFKRKRFGRMKEYPWVLSDRLVLAHFPVRSAQQIMTKAIIGWLSILAKPNKEPTEGFHIKLLFDRIIKNDQLKPEELTNMALNYVPAQQPIAAGSVNIVRGPVRPEKEDFMLKYTASPTATPLSILAQIAEEFAEALGVVRRKLSSS